MYFDFLDKDCEKYKEVDVVYKQAVNSGDKITQWKCIQRVCTSIVKKLLKGVKVPEEDVYEMGVDSTIKVVEAINRRKEIPKKLSSYVYLYTLGVVYNPKKKFSDTQYSLDQLKEDLGDKYLKDDIGDDIYEED